VETRPIAAADVDAVLGLNAESVWALSPLDADKLALARVDAERLLVVEAAGAIAAFAVAYGPGARYESPNYAWFSRRYDDFLYLDRIAVGTKFRRRGIATLLYDEMETAAKAHGRMVCEVYTEPPNPGSLAFHAARGYQEVERIVRADGHAYVMLAKPL
jgi:uncharacterized protein